MDLEKQKRLEAAGWRFGTVEEFLAEPLGTLAYTALENVQPVSAADGGSGKANSALVRFEPGVDRD